MEKGKTLVIWLKDGKTLHFEQVESFDGLFKGTISFIYFGLSTQTKMKAVLDLDAIAGYALES
ncbi:hypothetical protein [Listeria ivanovii]|uniref:hypothetical protein n=1 Tax=Listeria ivanovii TaxID=1638 RepID=UPI001941A688|nr:hypothetical protein [Listeria ivanovii]MBM5707682.1 hypothetical protein [Listeria ivanovii]